MSGESLRANDAIANKEKTMGFYVSEPFHTASAVLIESPSKQGGKTLPGTVVVTVSGSVPNYTGGIQLMQNTAEPGLTVEVMGWTGPIGKGHAPYKVTHSFPVEAELTSIFVVGSNKTET